MACALCRSDSELCSSHIVPEFFYRPIYDEDNRTLSLRYGETRAGIIQKGQRERLLCRRCEDQFQRYEDYFARYWYQKPAPARGVLGEALSLDDLDYPKLKLLLLSIVWRASVAKQKPFDSAHLGSKHEEAIRRMILDEEPGTKRDYPIIAGLLVDPKTHKLWDNVMLLPLLLKVSGHWAHRMVFGGVSWTVFVSNQKPPAETHWLAEDGSLLLPCHSYEDFARHSGLSEVAKRVNI